MAQYQDVFEPYFEEHRAETAFVHESSYIDTPCRIGEHTTILHFTHIMAHSIIGNYCHIGRNVTIASGVFVGDNVKVMNNTQLNSGVILENEVYCGPSTIFTESKFVRASIKNISQISPTLVRHGAQIGANTTIASGSTIGRFSFIEAGTVIDRNIPDFAVAYGNPLKLAGWRCQCGQMMPSPVGHDSVQAEILCSYCSRRYLRQSKWKVLQLAREDSASDSNFESDPSIRTTQRAD